MPLVLRKKEKKNINKNVIVLICNININLYLFISFALFAFIVFFSFIYCKFPLLAKFMNYRSSWKTLRVSDNAFIFWLRWLRSLIFFCAFGTQTSEYLILITVCDTSTRSRDKWSWQTDRQTTEWSYKSSIFSFRCMKPWKHVNQ